MILHWWLIGRICKRKKLIVIEIKSKVHYSCIMQQYTIFCVYDWCFSTVPFFLFTITVCTYICDSWAAVTHCIFTGICLQLQLPDASLENLHNSAAQFFPHNTCVWYSVTGVIFCTYSQSNLYSYMPTLVLNLLSKLSAFTFTFTFGINFAVSSKSPREDF